MGLRISFFKTPKHKVFNYTPLYWDPAKEDLDKRVRRAQAEIGMVNDSAPRRSRSFIHGSFQKAMYENKRHAGNPKILRIVVILTFAMLLAAVFYFTKIMEVIFSSL